LGRRNQSGELLKEVKEGIRDTEKEFLPQTSAVPVTEHKENNTMKADISDELTEEERVAKLTSSTVKTGLGKLTKHSDGSFDFDWK
jgi:hypothetical protein